HVDTSLGHEGTDDADARFFAEQPELLAGSFPDAAVASEDDRLAGVLQEFEGFVHDLVVRYRTTVTARRHRHLAGFVARDVLRQLDVNRARLFRARQSHGFADDLRDRIGVAHAGGPFGHRLEHPDDVHHLVRFLVQALGRTLP